MKSPSRAGQYKVDEIKDAKLSVVDAGNDRVFLVSSGILSYARTVIFIWVRSYGRWVEVSSREGAIDPELAVTGFLLGPDHGLNLIDDLHKKLASRDREIFRLTSEKVAMARKTNKAVRSKRRG